MHRQGNTPTMPLDNHALVTRALVAHVTDDIAKALFHADTLTGNAERGACWDTTTEADREHYRARARKALREQEPIALDVAMHKAYQAAEKLLPACLSAEGKRTLRLAVEAAIAAREAHLLHGRPEQDERAFEQIHEIPAPAALRGIDGGKALADDDEPMVRRQLSPYAAGLFGLGLSLAERMAQREPEDVLTANVEDPL